MTELYTKQSGFQEPTGSIEFVHRLGEADTDYSLSETSYFGFNIPEQAINCEVYYWLHPVLGVASGGVMLWRGHKDYSPAAEHLNYQNFLPFPDGDLADVTYANGVRIEVLDPAKVVKVSYRSDDGRVAFEFTSSAIMPAAVRLDGLHFAQAMRTQGHLELDGESFDIDGHFTRDRSWSSPRSEISRQIPPLTWGAAVFGDDLAFHFVAHDQSAFDGEPPHWGYVYKDGALREITRLQKVTKRASDGIVPVGVDVVIGDSAGDRYTINGVSQARLPVSIWPNMVTHFVQMRYSLDGRVGYGDFQDIQFANFFHSSRQPK